MLARVFNQDTYNLPRVQLGLHATKKEYVQLRELRRDEDPPLPPAAGAVGLAGVAKRRRSVTTTQEGAAWPPPLACPGLAGSLAAWHDGCMSEQERQEAASTERADRPKRIELPPPSEKPPHRMTQGFPPPPLKGDWRETRSSKHSSDQGASEDGDFEQEQRELPVHESGDFGDHRLCVGQNGACELPCRPQGKLIVAPA